MGVRILYDAEQNMAALYCSTSDVAFGPVFYCSEGAFSDADERAEAFLRWIQVTSMWRYYEKVANKHYAQRDVRQLTEAALLHAYSDWLAQEQMQATREDEAERVKLEAE